MFYKHYSGYIMLMGSSHKCLHVLAPLILEDGGVAPFNDVTLGFY